MASKIFISRQNSSSIAHGHLAKKKNQVSLLTGLSDGTRNERSPQPAYRQPSRKQDACQTERNCSFSIRQAQDQGCAKGAKWRLTATVASVRRKQAIPGELAAVPESNNGPALFVVRCRPPARYLVAID